MTRHGVRLAVSLVILGSLMTPQAASAFGYKDTGFDPDDRAEDRESSPDIRSSTRKVWASADGRGWLTIRLESYEEIGMFWDANVRLDSRGGPRGDHWMYMGILDTAGAACNVRPMGSPRVTTGDIAWSPQGSHWVRCRLPLRSVDPNKRIRWKVLMYGDNAPDHSWYP